MSPLLWVLVWFGCATIVALWIGRVVRNRDRQTTQDEP